MKIRNRLALQFTLISGVILSVIFVLLYLLCAQFMRNSFYSLLQERAYITAQVFLEKDELAVKKFLDVQKRYQQGIPGETSNIYDENNAPVFIEESKYSWPPGLLNTVRAREEYRFVHNGKPALGIYYKDNQGNFVVIVIARNKVGNAQLNFLMWLLIGLYAFGLTIVFFMGRWFSRKALQPVHTINEEVKNIRSNNLHLRVNYSKNKDEVDELAHNFNELLERLEIAFAKQASFVSNASHELRTPLTTIIGEIEVNLQKERTTAAYIQTLQSVLDEAEKLRSISNGLLELTRADYSMIGVLPQDIRIDEMLWELQAEFRQQQLQLNIILQELPEDTGALIVWGNRQLLKLAINNIIRNAFKFSHNKPVDCLLKYSKEGLLLAIQDRGIGIAQEDVEQIFMPLFRAHNARSFSGFGIGLAMSEKIIALHDGSISVDSVLGEGSTFNILFLPRNVF
ncbi:signal transduction histidine kinase [Chitinophaga skermanii]|uniref:histidine kinase n=1 Tax=Chitinophaga skermanii TaxID=331697 RepID=A0A327Q6V6_9BACT|nr:ATP-binding protein [Chitinophaga skermanii]RAI99714.1 signal transduction histidine kinase [Chitinophaga skermanii]